MMRLHLLISRLKDLQLAQVLQNLGLELLELRETLGLWKPGLQLAQVLQNLGLKLLELR
jgi:hypothetical protein